MPLVLGVDSSTQATKVEVRDADDGRLLASGRAPHSPTAPPRSEQDPTEWWDALVTAVQQTGARDIAALAVAGQQHGLVVLDGAGAPLRRAKLWNDTESAAASAALVRQLGPERWAKATGVVPVASITISKLAWLAATTPELLGRIETILLPHDYLTYRLTGRYVTDRGDASGTGYWSPFEERWRPDLLDRYVAGMGADQWAAKLPRVLGPTEPSDWATASIHEQLRLRGRPLCGPGTGDNMAAALGVNLGVGDVAISLGTSGTVYAVADDPVADPTGAVAGFADASGRYLPLVCTLNATLVTDAIARLLGVDHDGLDALALEANPGADGVVLVPYFDGERTPNLPNATGLVSGLRSDVEREQVARAAYEGVVCGLLDGLDALVDAGVPINGERIVLVGGGARSAAYRQIVADLAGVPVEVPDGDEHVATGACVQAAAMLAGASPGDVATAWGLGSGETVEPDSAVDAAAVRNAYRTAVLDKY